MNGWLLVLYSTILIVVAFGWGWTEGTDRARREHAKDIARIADFLQLQKENRQ